MEEEKKRHRRPKKKICKERRRISEEKKRAPILKQGELADFSRKGSSESRTRNRPI